MEMEEKEKRETEADNVRYRPGDWGGGTSWGSPHHTELFSLPLVGVVTQGTEHTRSAMALPTTGSHSVPLADFS